jgi:hypothetical protein
MIFWSTLAFAQPDPCFSMQNWNGWKDLKPLVEGASKSGLEHRDTFNLPNVEFSDNFALHWGNDAIVDDTLIYEILESFELTWDYQINELGFHEPYGSERYYFNVYLGDSGDGAPPDYEVSGYYFTDDENMPMVVLGEYVVNNFASAKTTIPHEFFHAVQHATESYTYSDADGWYWEATAVWIENEVYPLEEEYSIFLFGFAFLPHYALEFFDYFDSGALQEYYQYGAFVFPKFLTEFYVDSQFIRDSWMEATELSPLQWIQQNLEEDGEDFEQIMSDFAAKNVHWDYPDRDWYELYLDYYTDIFPEGDNRITQGIHSAGTADWEEVDSHLKPSKYGYNHLQLTSPTMEDAYFYFDGNTVGDFFSDVEWQVQLVVRRGESIWYYPIILNDGSGEGVLTELAETDIITISVLAASEEASVEEVFTYRYALRSSPWDEEEPKTTSCSSLQENHLGGLSLLLSVFGISLLLVRVRKR